MPGIFRDCTLERGTSSGSGFVLSVQLLWAISHRIFVRVIGVEILVVIERLGGIVENFRGAIAESPDPTIVA